ncbi:hypothetical protein AAFC00_005361 [Neodothiora populina]|uniref:DSBA-like thioredoxin domain-containing protein n=1 Tax=Neodothiora populina TaxID=2781224 RepID=A0ABR3PKN7_9PEZI
MTTYRIEIVSDVVCPWCYVGKNRLDAAIASHKTRFPQDTFSTTWAPFYLNPDAPKQSVDKQAMYESKFGVQRTRMMQIRLAQIGKSVGIEFGFGGKTGNTRDAHRLIQLAKTKGEETQTRVVERLFNAYFEKNQDITDHAVLSRAAVEGGIGAEEVEEWLGSDKGGPEVDREVAQAKRKFISGVPNFTINDVFEVQGAEEPSAFLDIFRQIKQKSEDTSTVSSGNTC